MAEDFESKATPVLTPLLDPGEELRGVVAATFQKTFSGAMWAIGVTDRRLVFQAFDRKWKANGPLRSASSRESLASADIDGAGDGWWTTSAAIADMHSLVMRITLDDGERVKLMVTRGGMKLLGGESQRDGIAAMADLVATAHE
jgi:hypothetical protein